MNEPIKTVMVDGTIEYRLNGQLHRTDGPAMEWYNGDKGWFLNGVITREGGPALETVEGAKFWYANGKLHRTDGPAVSWPNGNHREWFIDDVRITVGNQDRFRSQYPNLVDQFLEYEHNRCKSQYD